MIEITNKIECCGCNACGDVCAHGAILFKTDTEGFLYPEVDVTKCSGCGLCEAVCPMLHKNHKDQYSCQVYGAYSNDESIRLDSTSGGIFSELASNVFNSGGYVGGAIYNENHSVAQVLSSNIELLPQLRSSKYLQSDARGVYTQILKELKADKTVLFCGTPCQVHALKNFIGAKYQEKLTTIDFICRGVNSPKVWQKYVQMLEKRYNSRAVEIKAKNKKWGWHRFSMRLNFENGQEYCEDRYTDLFFVGYLQAGNFCRPSCYQCQFKGFPQASDITLADFWGIETLDPSMDQDKGTSLVVINSLKGRKLFDSIKNNITFKQYSLDVLTAKQEANTSLSASIYNRKEFFTALDRMPFDIVAKNFFPHKKTVKVSLIRKIYGRSKVIKAVFSEMKFSFRNICKFIKWNYCSKQIIKNNYIIPLSDTVIRMDKNAKILVDGCLRVGEQQIKDAKQQTRIWLEEGAELHIKGNFTIGADSYVRVWKDSKLILHNGFFNEHVQVTAGDVTEIGDGCAVGRDVVIRSYDGHTISSDGYQIAKPITIGEHVWIGQGASILKGVRVGNGAIVAANAVVTKNVPDKSIVGGNPARIIRTDIEWK